jgi:hypothetical protein
MAAHLAPCPSCSRHVRVSDSACPFCSATLPADLAGQGASPLPSERLGRAALATFRSTVSAVAASAVVGASALGCAADAESGVPNAQQSAAGSSSAGTSSNGNAGASNNGGVTSTGGSTGVGGSAAGGDSGQGGDDFGNGGMPNIVPPYGIPPIPESDAGPSDAGTAVEDPGGQVPIYGAPPTVPS